MLTHHNTRNPILPLDVHVPDGEAHVMPDGKLYIYGSFDKRSDVFCSEEYHVVSTADLANWEIHGTALEGKDIPWFNNPEAPKYPGIDWSNPTPFIRKMLESVDHLAEKEKFETAPDVVKPPLLFAPDAVHKDGKYYLYFCMPDDSEGVAVADNPTGPFCDPIQLPCGGIDPAVFIDEDGQAYFYWGQLFSHGVKLNDDLISLDREAIVDDLVTEEVHYFHEGSSMRRIGDTYYLVYSNIERGKPTSLGYATSKSPLGPFEYRGIIIDNEKCDPASWNNHGSIEQFNGRWYVFYHRCSRGVQQYRRLCIEPITINEDGSIDEVKMTSQGVGKSFGPGEKIMGYQACELQGKAFFDTDSTCGEKLTQIEKGDQALYRYVQSESPFTVIEIAASGNGTISVRFDGEDAGTIEIKDGQQLSRTINNKAGTYAIGLHFLESDALEILSITLH